MSVLHHTHRNPISASKKRRVLTRYNYICVYCGERAYVVDHVIPYSYCLSDDESNLVAACDRCNLTVSNRMFDSFEHKWAWIRAEIGILSMDHTGPGRSFKSDSLQACTIDFARDYKSYKQAAMVLGVSPMHLIDSVKGREGSLVLRYALIRQGYLGLLIVHDG